jgi:hypothetical protein
MCLIWVSGVLVAGPGASADGCAGGASIDIATTLSLSDTTSEISGSWVLRWPASLGRDRAESIRLIVGFASNVLRNVKIVT